MANIVRTRSIAAVTTEPGVINPSRAAAYLDYKDRVFGGWGIGRYSNTSGVASVLYGGGRIKTGSVTSPLGGTPALVWPRPAGGVSYPYDPDVASVVTLGMASSTTSMSDLESLVSTFSNSAIVADSDGTQDDYYQAVVYPGDALDSVIVGAVDYYHLFGGSATEKHTDAIQSVVTNSQEDITITLDSGIFTNATDFAIGVYSSSMQYADGTTGRVVYEDWSQRTATHIRLKGIASANSIDELAFTLVIVGKPTSYSSFLSTYKALRFKNYWFNSGYASLSSGGPTATPVTTFGRKTAYGAQSYGPTYNTSFYFDSPYGSYYRISSCNTEVLIDVTDAGASTRADFRNRAYILAGTPFYTAGSTNILDGTGADEIRVICTRPYTSPTNEYSQAKTSVTSTVLLLMEDS